MVSEAPDLPSAPSAVPLDDEALCRRALLSDLPMLGLSLDELLRRVQPERKAA